MAGEGTDCRNDRENIDGFEWEQFLGWMRGFFELRRGVNREFEAFTADDVVKWAATSGSFAEVSQRPSPNFAQLEKDLRITVRPVVEQYLNECVASGTLIKEGNAFRVTENEGALLFWDYEIEP